MKGCFLAESCFFVVVPPTLPTQTESMQQTGNSLMEKIPEFKMWLRSKGYAIKTINFMIAKIKFLIKKDLLEEEKIRSNYFNYKAKTRSTYISTLNRFKEFLEEYEDSS